jgi:hypothetical protein
MIFQLLSFLLLTNTAQPDIASMSNPLSEFQESIPAFSHGSGLIYIPNVQNVSVCAHQCLTLGKGDICNSFDYNEKDKICDLNIHVLSREAKLKPSFDYVYHKRILDTHIQSEPNNCPQIIPCFCDHIGTNWTNFYTIQGNCISCTCKKMTDNNICPVNKAECECDGNDVQIFKRDINECLYCSCEMEEFINQTDGIYYNHIQLKYIQLNAGGMGYIDDSGDLWKRDTYYMNGKVHKYNNKTYLNDNFTNYSDFSNFSDNTTEESNIVNEEIYIDYKYRSHRYSDTSFIYHIPIDNDGDYIVRFYFFQLESVVNHFEVVVSQDEPLVVMLNETGLVIYETIMRLFVPFVSFDFRVTDMGNMTNHTSKALVSAIEMIYLYPTDYLTVDKPVICSLPNCTCPMNQTVYFYQNHSETPCYDCECQDISVEIIERNITIIQNVSVPCHTTTTCPSHTTTTVAPATTSNTYSNEIKQAVVENSQDMSIVTITTISVLGCILVVFIVLTIYMIRNNSVLNKKNRFLEEDSTKRHINNEKTTAYDNPLFVSSDFVSDSFQGYTTNA